MEMMEYESEGVMAEALTFTDNQSLLVKFSPFNLLVKLLFSSGTFYG
jgi:hypothetical protein